ncbi:enoyl-CoA hydratase/isomerase family protein [Heyndrickxia acidicola]|uniref:Enoyl-CoA hydratase/isomerase family protein n=1 Tax=Heyndrickxia acidicola TaxID=209389 RepID=A0ABU6MBY3_9BACI|nr:enoyl-CoA hydratase/isomerase family protein [Heyndrickxia acidicola]MED1202181.1 enoyl-CoA hydratase/isomerase family protein [Heyndrickxia acidicola]
MSEYEITLKRSGVLQFKINRPNKRNAVNYNIMKGFEEVLEQAEKDDSVKVLAFTGSGEEAFCSGGDLDEFHALITAEQAYGMLATMSKVLYRIASLNKPTIAVLNGTAVGGGCEIAAACDFRIAKKGIRLGFIQGSLAITTGWGGASLLFERILSSHALKILSEARMYDVRTLKEIDFIQEIYEDWTGEMEEAFLDSILKTDIYVLKAYKKQLVSKWKQTKLEERMLEESRQCAVLWEKPVHHEAVSRFRTGK